MDSLQTEANHLPTALSIYASTEEGNASMPILGTVEKSSGKTFPVPQCETSFSNTLLCLLLQGYNFSKLILVLFYLLIKNLGEIVVPLKK